MLMAKGSAMGIAEVGGQAHIDGKALLQPIPTPASFCFRQTKAKVKENSAWRGTS